MIEIELLNQRWLVFSGSLIASASFKPRHRFWLDSSASQSDPMLDLLVEFECKSDTRVGWVSPPAAKALQRFRFEPGALNKIIRNALTGGVMFICSINVI